MIALENVSKKYLNGETSYEALKNIDIKINPGEKVAITGPSGAGKSTLLNIMSTLDRPTSGSVLFDDKHLEGLGEDETARIRLTEFGFIFQDYMLMPTLNIWDNICLPVILSGEKVNNERISTYIEKLLPECDARSMPHQLSGGQQQRVGIARALATQPKVLFADEPTAALDRQTADEIMNILSELNKQGQTILMVTHSPRIAAYGTRMVFVESGVFECDEAFTGDDLEANYQRVMEITER